MIKFMPRLFFIFSMALSVLLSGCVTQSYENDSDTPVVENLSNNDEIAMTRISLGLGYLKMGNTTQAKLNLEKAKRFSPKLVQVYTAFAHYYDVVGEPELATQSYEKALSIDSEDPDTLNNYGVFLCRLEKYQAAEKFTLKAIAIPTYLMVSQSYENLALCQLKAKEYVKAEKYFTKSIQHSPNRASALLQMMRLQYIFSDYKAAQQYLRRYEKSTRRFSPEALALSYKVFEKQRNRKVAKNYASMLVKLFPSSYQAKQYILNGLSYIAADDLAKEYQLSLVGSEKAQPKKRVVVLSPKKSRNKPINTLQKTSTNEQLVSGNNHEKVVVKKTVIKKPIIKKKIEATEVKSNSDALIHVVGVGDNFYSISVQYNIHMKALERWNNISRNDVIKLNSKLYISDPELVESIPVNNKKNTEQEKSK
jgi:type IV pilus assembly protein PilF